MAKGEMIIDDNKCRGCGYCVLFCKQECIVMSEDRFTPLGYLLPVVSEPDKCNACGVCGMMCPHYAVEVYKFIEN
ncbi:MAG: 4Fe-4S binding protein [Thermodesulfobacteriota bacterium]|nr:4Fe-4S binding protein [Thermodesulfobacteriota bacterium]